MAQTQRQKVALENYLDVTYALIGPEPPCVLTRRMVQAGVTALEHHRDSYPDDLLVEAVYSAMHAQSPVRPAEYISLGASDVESGRAIIGAGRSSDLRWKEEPGGILSGQQIGGNKPDAFPLG